MAVLIAIYYDGANSLIFKPDSVNELVSTVPVSCSPGLHPAQISPSFIPATWLPLNICCVKYSLMAASRLPKMFPPPHAPRGSLIWSC